VLAILDQSKGKLVTDSDGRVTGVVSSSTTIETMRKA
jgi:hypothetical protein